jgi:two-component system response regulator YesN
MFKLIIVDDEASTRLGLKEYFDWHAHQIEVVGLANDGETALPLITELKPDIVLTDVKMPFMDGITLAGKIHELNQQIKIVFFSGYDDIEYLKSALRVDAIDYLLKPVDFEELEDVIRRVTSTIVGERDKKQLFQRLNGMLLQSFPLLREKFLNTLVRGGPPNTTWLQEQLNFLELKLSADGSYCALALNIDDYQSVYVQKSERDKQLTSFAVMNISQEILDDTLGGYVFETDSGQYACLIRIETDPEEERLFQIIDKLRLTILRILKLSLTIGVGSIVQGLPQVHHSFRMASEAANLKLYLGKNQIITMDSLQLRSTGDSWVDAKELEWLSALLKAADLDKLHEWLERLFAAIASDQSYDRLQCQRICLQVAMVGAQVASQLELGPSPLSGSRGNELWEELLQLETVDEMKVLLISRLEELAAHIRHKREAKSSNVVELVKTIIHDHMDTLISLNDLASRIFLTSTYICLLFKQETGETIHDYTTRVKMDKARELLADSRNKLYEVSRAIGYADSSYFTKLFKKNTGLTPSEYRETIR